MAKELPRQSAARGLEKAAMDRWAARASAAKEENRRAKPSSGTKVAGSWVMLA